ncbi:MAG: HD domain-containing protein [Planctomycetota bacterium]|nr:HD domain-containing protein [Planctomycetota bacterium]
MLSTTVKNLSSTQIDKLKKFGSRVNEFGADFVVCDAEGEVILLCEGSRNKADNGLFGQINGDNSGRYVQYTKRCIETGGRISRLEDGAILAVGLKSGSESNSVAIIDMAEIEAGCDNADTQSYKLSGIFSEMMVLLAESFNTSAKAEEQIDKVSNELAHTYEELVLLHKVSTHMKLTESDANFLQMACDSLTNIVSVEGIAILLERMVGEQELMVVVAGSGLIDIDERMAGVLRGRLTTEIDGGKEALLDSDVDDKFKYDWPENIKNIIAVPLCGKDKSESHVSESSRGCSRIIGMMVAVNRIDKPDFDSTDINLFNSVANSCAVFVENGRLFKELQELFIGSLKALTNSIDAKDQYTRGHSERVAFISHWIAEKLVAKDLLTEEQLHRIYLSGLLHDIGKIGVDESVLRKKGKLTEEERDCIKTHPSIGAGILNEIKQMRDIVPGILCHHERIDGRGYPNGLIGDEIPLMGKIIGLADSFDAMTSDRVYRPAMTVEEAIAEIEKGLGTQFDGDVAKAFIESDVYHMWAIMQDGFREKYGTNNLVEYGTLAVGTLIR